MLALRLDARYNPDTDELEIMLPPDMNPAKLRIVRESEGHDEHEAMEDDPTLTEAELAELLKPGTPRTGAEIAARIRAEGGGWEQKGITDSVAWLREQRRIRRERRKW
jgi:hypothetical protein